MRIALQIILFLIFPYTVTAQLTGKVVSVADGDTFTLLINDKTIRVRLHGIDCPEKGQDFANVAKEFLAAQVVGKIVRVKQMDTDRYGRTIGMVYVDSVNVNEALLRAGLAWHYTYYDKNATWAALQVEARKAKLNIWSLPNPVAPWDFRRLKANR